MNKKVLGIKIVTAVLSLVAAFAVWLCVNALLL